MKTKLLALTILLVLFSLGTYLYVALDLFTNDKKAYVFESGLSSAEALAEEVLGLFKHATNTCFSLAVVSKVDEHAAQSLLELEQDLLVLSIVGRDSNGHNAEKRRITNHSLLKEFQGNTPIKADLLEQLDLSKYLSTSGEHTAGMKVMLPTEKLGIPTLVVVISNKQADEHYIGVVGLGKISDTFRKNRIYRNSLLTANGTPILSENESGRHSFGHIKEKKIDRGTLEIFDGAKDILVAFVRLPEVELTVISEISQEQAFAAGRHLIRQSIFYGVVLIGASIALSVLLAVSITRPISKLLEGTERVAAGDFEIEVKLKTRDELGVLADSFNLMGHKIAELLQAKELMIAQLKDAKLQLENYSKNLETMVADRTRELREAHAFLDAMINSLDQGLLVFGQDNICHQVYTKSCEYLFQMIPSGKKIEEVLKIENDAQESFIKWCAQMFQEPIPFEHVAELGVDHLEMGGGHHEEGFKYVGLRYYAMRDEEQTIQNVVVVGTDKTSEVKAQRLYEEERHYVEMVIKILEHKEQFFSSIKEINQFLSEIKQQFVLYGKEGNLTPLLGILHSLRGVASLFSIDAVYKQATTTEDQLVMLNLNRAEGSPDEQTFEQLKKSIEELEVQFWLFLNETKKFVGEIGSDFGEKREFSLKTLESFHAAIVDPNLKQQFETKFLRVPIGNVFGIYNLLVQDVAKTTDKLVAPLLIEGGDLRIRPKSLEPFFTEFPHLLRNCVDHGIEPSHVREELGKKTLGTIGIICKLEKQNGHEWLTITVSDDGAGIDLDAIKNQLREKAKNPALAISDQEAMEAIFIPALSTAHASSKISGRGVGLSRLHDAVVNLQGTIRVESIKHQGSRFHFRLPWS